MPMRCRCWRRCWAAAPARGSTRAWSSIRASRCRPAPSTTPTCAAWRASASRPRPSTTCRSPISRRKLEAIVKTALADGVTADEVERAKSRMQHRARSIAAGRSFRPGAHRRRGARRGPQPRGRAELARPDRRGDARAGERGRAPGDPRRCRGDRRAPAAARIMNARHDVHPAPLRWLRSVRRAPARSRSRRSRAHAASRHGWSRITACRW